ncbi:hypothetical protein [Marinobacter sp.]|uniref:hypothetical protein n=1 Tax=Marinobacter sp. TaxID=50741 RepID=UPI003A9276F4
MSTEVSTATGRSPGFPFGIRRLVLVDSAGFCYVEIPVDSHALILGPGNLGKSSLLNSLRLFLLPENNFKNSRKKFAFRNASAGSFYTNDESYQHYFPSHHSFLIMEVENLAGVHCQILYREHSSQLSYGRAFVPVSYDQLRPLFWDVEDAEGIGRAQPELSFSRVSEAIKKLSKDTLFTSDPARLKSLLYSSELMSADRVRFSVLPLGESDERRVQSLRTLILLLFEMKADDQAMANAVASIIEADKKFADDAFDFNIDQFLDRHDDLKGQQAQLNQIEKERGRFDRLNADYQKYRQLLGSQQEFAAFRDGLVEALTDIGQRRSRSIAELNEHKDTLKFVKEEVSKLERDKHGLQVQIKTAENKLKLAEQNRNDGELLVSRYGDMPRDEIEALLSEELKEKQSHLNALRSNAQAEIRAQELLKQIESGEHKLKALRERESKQQWQLKSQLEAEVIAPLQAVDQRLVMASPGRPLDEHAKAVIAAFSGLFESGEGRFDWFDVEFPAQALKPENFAAMRSHIESDLRALHRERDELTGNAGQKQDRPQQITRTEKEVRSIEKDLETLERYPAASTIIKDETCAIAENREKLTSADEKIQREHEKLGALESKVGKAQEVANRCREREEELVHVRKSVSTVEQRIQYLQSARAQDAMPVEEVCAARFDDIQRQLDDLDKLRISILTHLRYFIYEGVLDDSEGELQKDSPSSTVIRDTFKALSDLFDALGERWQVLEEEIAIHNETVASYRRALKTNHDHIARFEAQLNRELAGVQINDLVEIRVDIHTDPKFRNLVEESAAIDPYNRKLQSDAFYERLKVFVAEFFGDEGGSNRLTMDKVITGISYSTRKQHTSHLDKKGQSTSTTALINLELVYRLLKRVLYPDVRLSFPMVLDELASIDISQMPSLLARLREQGFNLFSAATHSASSEVIYLVGKHLEVGQMHTSRPYSPQRTLVFWGGAEGFTDQAGLGDWVDHNQNTLLDASNE